MSLLCGLTDPGGFKRHKVIVTHTTEQLHECVVHDLLHLAVVFCSLAILDRGLATRWTYFLNLSLSSVILIDSSAESTVHVLMLSIQAVRGLPRLRAPGVVPCIISFSRQFPCFL